MIYVTDDLQVTPASTTGQPSPVNSWQWRRNGQSIENAVASTYRLTDADVGQSITVTQTASNLIGKAYAESAAVNPLAFDPIALYRNNEQGAWYDPSDFDRYTAPLGPELVANGDFASAAGWVINSIGTGTVTISGGAATLVGTDALNRGSLFRTVSCVIGRSYKVTAVISGAQLNLALGSTSGLETTGGAGVSSSGLTTFTVVASAQTMYIKAWSVSTGGTATIDNISVKELTAISTATMFQDSAGTTPVTAMEQPVGLILDKRKGLTLGNELVTSSWAVTGAGISQSGGVITFASSPSTDYAENTGGVVSGKGYIAEFTVTGYSGSGGVSFMHAGNSIGIVATANGRYRQFFYATSTGVLGIRARLATTTAVVSNISVKELPGNHAFQTTSTSRPVLSARYNLLTKTEQFDDTVWTKQANATITANQAIAPDGTLTADLYTCTAIGGNAVLQSGTFGGVVGVSCTLRIKFKYAGTGRWVRFMWSDGGANQCRVWVDTQNGVLGLGNANGTATYVSSSLVALSDGWYELSLVGSQPGATGFFQINGVDGNGSVTTASAALYLWGADLRVSNDALNQPSYQRVNTATDYDSTGFKPYLRFDGTDDWLQTNSVDFTATDKMTVFAGVRKLSTTANQMLSEFGTGDQNGSFYLLLNAVSFGDRFRSQGGAGASADDPVSVTPPISRILTGIGNISGDSAILRVNGTQAGSSTSDQGTGNYGNYPIYIGRRGGTTLPFNGRLYGLIIRGATTKSEAIVKTEQYMAGKTGNQL